MSSLLFYREQAARERTEAEGAVIANVRARHLRAENAWNVLAERIEHTDSLRAARDGEKLLAAETE